ncbi:MAG: OmpH family outer membrane protein [Taibaiella sp.]|nr:OmpH family outer membrane protein [Taibaiella sp.]
MKKIVLFLAIGLCSTSALFAQATKFGYINSSELLVSMPEKAKADTIMSKYEKSFQSALEAMQKEGQAKVQQYTAQEKTLSDAMKEVKQKEIQDLQGRIEGLQQSAQEKIAQKKQETYGPILEKADKAIKEVAKEKNYDYVFDSSAGALLYAKESDNILPLVKAKLGIIK